MFGIVKKPDYAILATYVVDSKFAKITHVLEHLQTFWLEKILNMIFTHTHTHTHKTTFFICYEYKKTFKKETP